VVPAASVEEEYGRVYLGVYQHLHVNHTRMNVGVNSGVSSVSGRGVCASTYVHIYIYLRIIHVCVYNPTCMCVCT